MPIRMKPCSRPISAANLRPADRARMVIYKAMCDLLWTLWGLIQLANNNPAEDFRAYADGRFARCRALMASPEFSNSLATLKSGGN
jgi:thiamine kinase-like enzyme